MSRPRTYLALVLLAAAGAALLLGGRRVAADASGPHRIVFLFVSGQGPQAKAWYDGAPPQGVLVQNALDKFAADGFHYVAISSSGGASVLALSGATPTPFPATTEGAPRADYVILLER